MSEIDDSEVFEGMDYEDFFAEDESLEAEGDQEVSEPEETEEPAGAEEPEDDAEESPEDEESDAKVEDAPKQLTDEQIQARIDAVTKQRMDAFYKAKFGHLKNPLTGEMVHDEQSLENFQKATQVRQQQQKMLAAGIKPDQIKELVDNHPAVLDAQKAKAEYRKQAVETFKQSEYQRLLQAYPNCGIADLQDLMKTEEGQAVLKDWTKTHDIVKAYRGVMADQLAEKKIAAAKQSVRNDVNSKKQLQPKRQTTAKDTIPAGEMKAWKAMYPGATNAEIMAKWKKVKSYEE